LAGFTLCSGFYSLNNLPQGLSPPSDPHPKPAGGTVGVQIAREFLGSIKDDPTIVKGLLVTTGEFTSECIAFCHRNGIEMIPGIKVAEYVKMFSLKT